MASSSVDSVVEASGQASPIPTGTQHTRLRGKKKLIHSLKRIGSSQSIVGFGRSRGGGNYGVGPASISCISLSSSATPSSAGFASASYSSNVSNGFSTAPTTPGADTPFIDSTANARFINTDGAFQRSPISVPLPHELKGFARPLTAEGISEGAEEDYFSRPIATRIATPAAPRRPNFDFWEDMPVEVRIQIFSKLSPKQIVQASAVSKAWHAMCFDGQLWAHLDASSYYKDIPTQSLVKIISGAGPFTKDLNLRGCVQLWDSWRPNAPPGSGGIIDSCRNLQNISLEGCRIDRNSIHGLLYQNARLQHINLSGLSGVTNSTMKIIAQQCPRLTLLNVSWCPNVDARGISKIVGACTNLVDLRASEVRGFNNTDIMLQLFKSNRLERLVLMSCEDLSDEALSVLITGIDEPVDYLSGFSIVPPRTLKHLDLTRCRSLTDAGLRCLAGVCPNLEGLQLSKCDALTDESLRFVLPALPRLTHLDLEELEQLTNATLITLSKAPCAANLRHLNISYCEKLGDAGTLSVLKCCTSLRNLELDNTRISNLSLMEAADMIRHRSPPRSYSWDQACAVASRPASSNAAIPKPRIALRMAIYDCANVSWIGIREILARNATVPAGNSTPHQIIALKVFYGYQPTVTEHTRRCLSSNFASAQRLERKWASYMLASEEAGAPGGVMNTMYNAAAGFGAGAGARWVELVGGGGRWAGAWGAPGYANRRRRRRAREAALMAADEEVGLGHGQVGEDGVARGGRRRARSGGALSSAAGGGCSVM